MLSQLISLNPNSPQNYAWGAFKNEWPNKYPSFDEMNDFSDLEMSTIDVE